MISAHCLNKCKERPKFFFRRPDEAWNYHQGLDTDFQFSKIGLQHSTCRDAVCQKQEKEPIWELVNWVYDPEKFRETILFLFRKLMKQIALVLQDRAW